MKRLICLLAACMLLFAGCTGPHEPEHEPVLPPARVGSSSMKAQIPYFDLERACGEADLIAHIRVCDWLGERNVEYEMELTYFSASIIESFKGQKEGNFVLCQDGNSKLTLGGYPLFTYGDELLLFLKRGSNPDYDEMYYVVGSYGTVMYGLGDDNGDCYFMSICDGFYDSIGIERNYADDNALRDLLVKNCPDPLVKEMAMHSPFICRADDFFERIEAITGK